MYEKASFKTSGPFKNLTADLFCIQMDFDINAFSLAQSWTLGTI